MHCFDPMIVTFSIIDGNHLLIMMIDFKMRFLKGYVEIGRLNN
jgi:hypothetical protein